MKVPVLKYSGRILFGIAMLMFLTISNALAQKQYTLNYFISGKDTSNKSQLSSLKKSFDGKEFANVYINTLTQVLISKGFPAASVDSVKYDSTQASVNLY